MNDRRLKELDLLRFLAAIAVVFFHYAFRGYAKGDMSVMPYPLLAEPAKYGYLGVELFFMISGFVILMTASSNNLKVFFISRVVRLCPAFWVCCTLTFLFILAIGQPRFTATLYQYLINMTLLGDLMGVEQIDGVYWSLFVEIKFYLMISILLGFKKIEKIEPCLVLWLLVSATAEILVFEKLRSILITDYAAYFIAGATFYLIWAKGFTVARILLLLGALALACFTAIAWAESIESKYSTEYDPLIICGVIFLFFMTFLLIVTNKTAAIGRLNWTALGALTYPLYLLHQMIGFMIFNIAYPAVNPHLLLWGTLILMIGASWLIHKKVETPIARFMKRFLSFSLNRVRADKPASEEPARLTEPLPRKHRPS
ncbi:acyltransferase [Pseudomonas sp. N40(2020)]|uniref:acyltransferase family protein n=1 Tax=Pseudomonas sp. N40(2020) TaxID=2767798 RepID=UPI00165741D0|nr:acyltransferase [Pseudomonas sp. N40(2020)]MBC8998596.1 acyltransferase [Pseudomonas sp. N40(2020)]